MGAFLEITPNSEFVEIFVGKQIFAFCEFLYQKAEETEHCQKNVKLKTTFTVKCPNPSQ
jgi:hypothetical protein